MFYVGDNKMYELLVLGRMMSEDDIKTVIMALKDPTSSGDFNLLDWTDTMKVLAGVLESCQTPKNSRKD